MSFVLKNGKQPDVSDTGKLPDVKPPSGPNDDPRRQRLLNHMRPAPLLPGTEGLDPRMRRKLATENQQFLNRQGGGTEPPLDPRMRRKLESETQRFEDRNARSPQPPGNEGGRPAPRQAPQQPQPQQPQPPQQQQPQQPQPPRVPTPLTLPSGTADAIGAIMKAATLAQEAIRGASDQLYAIKSEFIGLQSAKIQGNDVPGNIKAMGKIADGVKQVNTASDFELTRLLALQVQLGNLPLNDPATPPAVLTQHQQATIELQSRIVKARTVCQGGHDLADRLDKSVAGTADFKMNDALPLYAPDAFEVPALMRDLTQRLGQHTNNFLAVAKQLQPNLAEATQLFATATARRPLPNGTPARIGELRTTTDGLTKPFSKWNASIIKSWRALQTELGKLPDPKSTEIQELSWRLGSAYDPYTAAFGQADEAGKSVTHLLAQVNTMLAPAPGSTQEAAKELKTAKERMEKLQVTVGDPIGRIGGTKSELSGKKKAFEKADTSRIKIVEDTLIDLNRDIEVVRANILALERAAQEVAMVEALLKTRYAGQKPLAAQVSAVAKEAAKVTKLVGPGRIDGTKTETAIAALIDTVNQARAALGPAASVEETTRLQTALTALPQAPTKDDLFPRNGVGQWKGQLSKGGDKKGATLFAAVTKGWEGAEKDASNPGLDKLEKAADTCRSYLQSLQSNDPIDAQRIGKCEDALRLVRKMRLSNDRAALTDPPWTEAEAGQAKRVEARTLLENGAKAKPPGAKGESDSFFLNDSQGKPAFIFKPKQGENVKEGGREGEGVAREVLSSKFNDQMKDMIGVDFGVCPTELVRLESDSFDPGQQALQLGEAKSREKSRSGAMQQTAENDGNLTKQCGTDPTVAASIPTEEVQKIALLDFLTLQGDRNPDNILVKDEGGKKRLIPIDGGFAFPSKEMFAEYSVGMAAEPKGGKTGKVEAGNNGLMQLPQSDEKFTPEMLKAIAKIDPVAMVKGMKQANAEMVSGEPDLDGMVGDENLENMRRSAVFLKQAAPDFTVAQLAEIYAADFKRILELPANKVDQAIVDLLVTAHARIDFNKDVKLAEAEYGRLGGDIEIKKLGWDMNDRMLRLDWKRKIEILRNQEAAPLAQPASEKKPVLSDEEKESRDTTEYRKLGGDKALTKLLQTRKDANYSPKPKLTDKVSQKVARLRWAKQFQDWGGDAAYKNLLDLYQQSRYETFDGLSQEGKAAVATFSASTWDPAGFDLMSKVTAFIEFDKYNR